MYMGFKSRVFIIDDDPIHQRITQIMITKNELFDEYTSYTEAQKAIDFLQDNYENIEILPDVILLDLNMPEVDGWDFLDVFEDFKQKLKKEIRVYIVSSSVDEKDMLRSKSFESVVGFISKPLSPDIIRELA